MFSKDDIRASLKKKRDGYKNHPVVFPSGFIQGFGIDKIISKNKTVASYMPISGEMDLTELHHYCLEKGITLCFPVVVRDEEMVFIKVTNLNAMKQNAFGIFEPVFIPQNVVVPDIFFVPALGFDKKGNRLGFGKGHYDRYFSSIDYLSRIKIGVVQSQSILATIPKQSHDISVDYILSEEGFKPALQD